MSLIKNEDEKVVDKVAEEVETKEEVVEDECCDTCGGVVDPDDVEYQFFKGFKDDVEALYEESSRQAVRRYIKDHMESELNMLQARYHENFSKIDDSSLAKSTARSILNDLLFSDSDCDVDDEIASDSDDLPDLENPPSSPVNNSEQDVLATSISTLEL
jgi:hypothetical protein